MTNEFILIMAIIAFSISLIAFYYGRKRNSVNILIWILIPLARSIHWSIEYISDNIEPHPFYLERLELGFALVSSFALLAASIEFTGQIKSPLGKYIAFSGLSIMLFYVILLPEDIFIAIEDVVILEDFIVESDPSRFLYGFLLPFASASIILYSISHSSQNINVQNIEVSRVMKRNGRIFTILIIVFSFIEGFDYEHSFYEFARSLALISFILIPVFIIITADLGLQRFLVIDENGIPIIAYSFKKEGEDTDSQTILTAAFISALTGLSEELSERQTSLAVETNSLFYSVRKSRGFLFVIQSVFVNSELRARFERSVDKIQTEGFLASNQSGSKFDYGLFHKLVSATF